MTVVEAVRSALDDSLGADRSVVLIGQLVKYGLGGLTVGLHAKYGSSRVQTFPVCENLMHAAALGLSLGGMRPVVVNERMDFLALAMDPLANHIPVWRLRDRRLALPLVVVAVVGKGKGQGPQHSKNFAHWFRGFDGWKVSEPESPGQAYEQMVEALRGKSPVLYVLHREFFSATEPFHVPRPEHIGLCGASKRHEREFYGDQ